MGYFKLIPYLFLVVAALFLIDAVVRLNNGEDPVISFIFTAAAIFMFFFRRRSYKRYTDSDRKQ